MRYNIQTFETNVVVLVRSIIFSRDKRGSVVALKVTRLSNRATGTDLLVLSHCLVLFSDLSATTFRIGITRSAIFLPPSYVSSTALSGSGEMFPGTGVVLNPRVPRCLRNPFSVSIGKCYRKVLSTN